MAVRRSDAQTVASVVLIGLLAACSHKPPASFQPDPVFAGKLRSIRVMPRVEAACPGSVIPTDYEAIHESGLHYPVARTYNKKAPPKLHVVFLNFTSPDATAQPDGDWVTNPDPLQTAMTGFRLNAFLRINPAVNGSAALDPDYSCMPHSFGFEGEGGGPGESGFNGPEVTVRLSVLRSPYYARLVVASIEVGMAPPQYVFADYNTIPPADWLIVESRGGRGGSGRQGQPGVNGADGTAGCPGSNGGNGGPGGPGGPGGSGGQGGHITVIVPSDEPLLAGLVETRSIGGRGGNGGPGGKGGTGGKAGAAQTVPGQTCTAGNKGNDGVAGQKGSDGRDGYFGPRGQILTVSRQDVYGNQVPTQLRDLINYNPSRR